MVTTRPQQTEPSSPSILMRGVSWPTYKALLADVGGDRAWRIAYDRGSLELRMPLEEHEEPKGLLESFIEAIADELGIEVRKLGSLTLEREDLARAVEPDSCFYIQHEAQVRGRKIHLPDDPPPDLVIESDYTHSSVNKQSIYAALGVPELWRYTNQTLLVYSRIEGGYEPCDTSLAFPILPIAAVGDFIEQSRSIGQRAAVRLFRQRIHHLIHQDAYSKNEDGTSSPIA